MHRAVEIFAIVHFTIIGLSHVVAAKAWGRFFALLASHGHAGVFAVAFMSLYFGSIVAAFHPVWTGIPMVLTILGWAQVAKGLLYFCWPAFGLKQIRRVDETNAHLFRPAGAFFLVLTGVLAYHLCARG
jgi:hypothetical protein